MRYYTIIIMTIIKAGGPQNVFTTRGGIYLFIKQKKKKDIKQHDEVFTK